MPSCVIDSWPVALLPSVPMPVPDDIVAFLSWAMRDKPFSPSLCIVLLLHLLPPLFSSFSMNLSSLCASIRAMAASEIERNVYVINLSLNNSSLVQRYSWVIRKMVDLDTRPFTEIAGVCLYNFCVRRRVYVCTIRRGWLSIGEHRVFVRNGCRVINQIN